MSYIEVYQGDTLRINLVFTDENGNPYNISGSTLFYTVKRNYSDSNSNAIITKVITGFDNGVSGLCHIDLTTGDTSQCAQDYVAGFTLIDINTGVSTFNTDGLRILPSVRGVS